MGNDINILKGFKSRLLAQVEEKFDGKHTRLARASGIGASTIQGWVGEKVVNPNAVALYKVAKACGVEVEWLLAGESQQPEDRDWIRLPRGEPLTTATRAAIEIALDVLQSGGEGSYDKILMQNIKSCKEGLDKQRKITEPLPERVTAGGSKTG